MSTATTYVVTSDRLWRVGEGGAYVTYFRGDTVTGLSEEDVERYKRAGAIASHSSDDARAAKEAPAVRHPAELSDSEPAAAPQASDIVAEVNATAQPRELPAKSASKEAWTEYAVSTGQLTEDECDALGRDGIRDLVQ